MQNGLKAVLFDFDGTLVFLPVNYKKTRSRLNELFLRWGIESDFHPLVGSVEESLAKMKRKGYSPKDCRDARNMAYTIMDDEETASTGRAKLNPGAKPVLSRLRKAGIKTAIVSRNGRKCIRMCIKKFGLPEPDVIAGRDDLKDIRDLKPSPRHALLCLKKLKTRPRDAVIVGDSEHDIVMGKNAGIKTVIINKSHRNNFNPDDVIGNLTEFRKLIYHCGGENDYKK